MNLVLKKLFLEESTNIPSGRRGSGLLGMLRDQAGRVTGCRREEGHVRRDWVVEGPVGHVEETGVFFFILQVKSFERNVCILEKSLKRVPY